MTIALVANSSWNLHHFRRNLIRRLIAEGHDILLLAAEDAYTPRLADLPQARFIPLRHLQAQRKNPFRELLLLGELYGIYHRERPDLVLHFTIKPNLYGSLAAGWLKIPNIATVTGLGYAFIHDQLSRRLIRVLYHFAFRKCTRVVFQNPDDQDLFLQTGFVEKNQVLLIPGSGIDTDYFYPRHKEENNRAFTFIFIGRLLYDKGIREFYESARQLYHPERAFWILGDTYDEHPNCVPKPLWSEWIASGVVQYYGFLEDIRPLLAQADVLVLPSYYGEGLPRSILEAMSMAKPILTTDVPGCRETVEPGKNGFLVTPTSIEDLVEAMKQIQKMDKDQRMQWGQYSRNLAIEKFSQRLVNDLYLEVINRICSQQ